MISQDPNFALVAPQVKPAVSGSGLIGDGSLAPFFVVGLGRSGTTLLSRMLDANSAIAVFPETWCYVILDRLGCLRNFTDPWQYRLFLDQAWKNLDSYNDPAARVWAEEAARRPSYVGPTAPILESLGRAYAEAKGAKMWGEKTPGHILWLPHIQNSFPKAKVIVTVRDPRDVIVSYDDRWGGGRRDTTFLMDTAALVRFYLRKLFDSPGFSPDQFFTVKYEELTSHPDPLLKKLCEFLEVDFEPGMLKFYERSRDWIATPEAKHHALLAEPATAQRVGRYRTALTEVQISSIETFLAVEMQSLGYPTDPDNSDSSAQRECAAGLARANRRYTQMQAGVFRDRLRRRGKLVLHSYKYFGRALVLMPARWVASTSQDWVERAAAIRQSRDDKPVRPTSVTPDDQVTAVTRANQDRGRDLSPSSGPLRRETVLGSEAFRQRIAHISQHSAVFFAGTMFTGLAGYLFKVYLARMIGAKALGLYALGMTVIAFIGIFNGLGLPQSAVRFVALYAATGKSNQLRGFLLRASALLLGTNIVLAAGVVMVGPWIAEHVYHTVELKSYFPLFSLIMLLGALTSYGGQVLQGYKDVARRTVITNFIGTPSVILLTIIFLQIGWGLWGYIFAQLLSAVMVLGLLIAAVRKLTPPEVFRHKGPLPPLGSQVVSFGVAALGVSMLEFLLGQTDKILIGFYINAREVGVYAVAMAVVAFVPIALQSVNQIFAPTISDLHSRGESQLLSRLFQTITKWVFAFTLPLATVVSVFAKPLMGIFGADFVEGWPVLVVGALGQLINCGTGSVGYLLLMSGNQKRLIKVQATMSATMILLNIALIPRFGIIGAAIATAITMAVSNAWYLGEVRTALGMLPFNRSYLKMILPCIGMVAATLIARSLWTHTRFDVGFICGSLVMAYAVFFTAVLPFGLDADDRVIGRAVWTRLCGSIRKREADL